MKKPLLYLILMLGSLSAVSQSVPQKINYQGVARRGDGSAITSHTLGLKFEILQGSSSGNSVYSETQSQSTNTLGLFNATIGSGTSTGSISTIDWTAGPYYLSVSVDTTGGTGYVLLGTQQMMSVPYALAAGSAPTPSLGYNNNILTVGSNSVGIFVGGSSPNLSISGNTLSITGGSASVVLPGAPVLPGGATTVSLTQGGYQVHTDSITLGPTGLGYGLLTVGGSYPNFKIGFIAQPTYDPTTGVLTLSVNPYYNTSNTLPVTFPVVPAVNLTGTALSVGPLSNSVAMGPIITPALTGNLLSVGPSTNNVDMNPIAPWRYSSTGLAANTVSLGVVGTLSVGINNIGVPSAELEVTGYTKLGDNTAPGIKMVKLTGTTSSASSGITSITIPSYVIPSKILAVSVLVDLNGSGNWIPPGYNPSLLAGTEYYWKINSGGPAIEILNSASNYTSIIGKNIKVLITYEQ